MKIFLGLVAFLITMLVVFSFYIIQKRREKNLKIIEKLNLFLKNQKKR